MLTKDKADVALVVKATEPFLKHWLALASHESRTAAAVYDNSIQKTSKSAPKISAKRAAKMKAMASKNESKKLGLQAPTNSTPAQEDPEEGIVMQTSAASVLGILGSIWPSVGALPCLYTSHFF
eukprot:Plantae.Rhodophyta-Purpureofilum_apyrenoidigerum.ctg54986.p1 GENE.Plantae.Rhodophyta-Purpureofilum_apyrenoidigerum.ctg54986~~Plantae.Rhodophyta-Purpureofilum_apyrenoidigerum.ctg54986.p1  ORF type:complete len:124 (-),score=17.91 Plantae.Rhodophyta-Purpureofilum_apyrenoidigerum.ctg54986:13-384(-)